MNLLGHLTKIDGHRYEQTLKEHCFHTAQYAAESIGSAKFYHLAYLSGILHDMGKAKKEYAEYLEKAFQGDAVKRGSVNHTFAGVVWLFARYHDEKAGKWERLTCEICAYAAGAHHGMFDCVDLDGKNGFLHRLRKERQDFHYDESVSNFLSQIMDADGADRLFGHAVSEVREFFEKAVNSYQASRGKVFFQISMLVRMILSAVIYGDRRDTSEFMKQNIYKEKKPDWKRYRIFFENKIGQFNVSTELNLVRKAVSEQCLSAAGRPSGIYRLNVPTGAGKTLCTLRYALAHAEKYEKKRIIFIIPLLSVLDQNVKVIRDYIPDENEVLEHHSNVVHEDTQKAQPDDKGMNGRNSEAGGERLDPLEFLAESWNYPIVVSTLVQLLNILFSDQMSAAGRMQALCDSVIVIDEVQTLPKKITVMFNMALNFLQAYCNASIVLSSATHPCFEQLGWPMKFAPEPDLVCLSEDQRKVFKRAEVIDRTTPYGMDWEECAAFCREQAVQYASLLVICNTKAEAGILFQKLNEQAETEPWDIYHLSTAMCQRHRMEVLNQLKKSLYMQLKSEKRKKMRKVVCISTQLIEAGVDLSFACVIRVLAGIDNLAQSAGRCNRSNEYGLLGRVYLINLKGENLGMLREIKSAQDSTKKVINEWKNTEESLIEEQAARKFYEYLFAETKKEIRYPFIDGEQTLYLADLLSNQNGIASDSEENKRCLLHEPFKTIGQVFQIFDENTIDVIVPFGGGSDLIEKLKVMQKEWFENEKFRKLIKQAQKYTVSIYEWQREKLDQAGMLERILDDRILILNDQAYDDRMGLCVMEEQAAANYIF